MLVRRGPSANAARNGAGQQQPSQDEWRRKEIKFCGLISGAIDYVCIKNSSELESIYLILEGVLFPLKEAYPLV